MRSSSLESRFTPAGPVWPGESFQGSPGPVVPDRRTRSTLCAWPQGRSKVDQPLLQGSLSAGPEAESAHPTIGVRAWAVKTRDPCGWITCLNPHATRTVPRTGWQPRARRQVTTTVGNPPALTVRPPKTSSAVGAASAMMVVWIGRSATAKALCSSRQAAP